MPISDKRNWGGEKTTRIPRYRIMTMGAKCGPMIHITPEGTHVVTFDLDCEGCCLDCGKPLEAN